ncbi:MAG: M20 family metallopeptidase [Polyangiaceae bacterium]
MNAPDKDRAVVFDALRERIAGRTEPMLEDLRELVDINSYTSNKAGGDRVAEILAARASALGLEARRIASEKFADHWVLSTKRAAHSAEGAVVLVGHIDTVFPPGSFEGFRRDGALVRGPGVLDMKGGIVIMLEALRALSAVDSLDNVQARIVLVGDEEVGSPEGRGVIQRETAGAKSALVFEAGRAADKIITSRKGTGSGRAIAIGKAAHAANGHKDGVNAIWALAKFIDKAQSLTDYARGVTVNVGVIQGGEAKNTVPDRCECQLDFRFERISDADATYAALKQFASEAAAAVAGSSIELSGGPGRMPLERTDANLAVYRAYAEHARAAGLGGDEAPLIAGGSDASSTAAIGIPSIDGLGPRGSGFHTKDELIEVASLEPKVEALARYLWDFARG